MIKVGLGDAVKDGISGFAGIATGRAEYLTGCVQIQVVAIGGEKPLEEWIDEQRLYITGPAEYGFPGEAVEQAPAGPQHTPPARHP